MTCIITLRDLPRITPEIHIKLRTLRLSEKTEVIASHNGISLAPPIPFSSSTSADIPDDKITVLAT